MADILERTQLASPFARRELKGGVGGHNRTANVLSIERYFLEAGFQFSADAKLKSLCLVGANEC
ncbi:MAG: hypothetical protein ABSB15_21615 [Bryobacteraceae bacterium]|jgi:hypothetical protein